MQTHSSSQLAFVSPDWPSVELGIAGLDVRLFLREPQVAQAIARRYQDFPISGEPVFQANVAWQPKAGASVGLEADTRFEAGALYFTPDDYQGVIDVGQGGGWLRLSSSDPVAGVEYFVRCVYALLAFQAGGLLFHAAGIVRKQRAHVFFGYSGSGKTTVARLSPDAKVLNDDLLVLLPEAAGWRAYATPFWNPTQVRPSHANAPLAALYRLVQDRQVFLSPLPNSQALAEVIANVPVVTTDPERGALLLERAMTLLRQVPAYRLHFLPDPSFWQVIDN